MATTIRMSRGGAKKKPYYRIVVTDSRKPRDSGYIEKLGTYTPTLPAGDPKRVELDADRVKHWLGQGATTSETVARFLRGAGLLDSKPAFVAKAKGTGLKKKAADAKAAAEAKIAEEAAAKEAAEAEAKAAKEAPAAEEAPAASGEEPAA